MCSKSKWSDTFHQFNLINQINFENFSYNGIPLCIPLSTIKYAYLFQTLRTVYICSLVQISSVHKGRLENRQIVTRNAFYGVLALLVCMWLDMVALLLMIISHKDSMAT